MDFDHRLRVLLVEDDPIYVAMLDAFLSKPLDLHNVPTLRLALKAAADIRFDIALLDLRLPDSSGVDTIRRFRREAPGLPVVAISAYMDDEMVTDCLVAGAEHALDKEHLMPGASDLLVWLLRTAELRHAARTRTSPGLDMNPEINSVLDASAKAVRALQVRMGIA